MKVADGADAIPQRGDLTDHIHAFAALIVERNLDVPRTCGGIAASCNSLAGYPKASEIQLLQFLANLLVRLTSPGEQPPGLAECIVERSFRAARRMPRTRFENDGLRAIHRHFLERLDDRAGFHGLTRKQIRRAHQHSDADPALDQRRRHRGDHRGRHRIVDTTGECDVELLARNTTLIARSNTSIMLSQSTKLVRGPI